MSAAEIIPDVAFREPLAARAEIARVVGLHADQLPTGARPVTAGGRWPNSDSSPPSLERRQAAPLRPPPGGAAAP